MKRGSTAKTLLATLLALALPVFVMTLVALASSVDESIVDTTAPTGSVTLAPGASGVITINLRVTGNQVGTATFDVYRDWTLSGGVFTGSNPQTFTVPPRAAQDPATTFSTSGTVTVASGQADGMFTLAVAAFNITNSNQQGGKLAAGASSNYQVTVEDPPPPAEPLAIAAPADLTVEGNTTGGANITDLGEATASGGAGGYAITNNAPASGFYPLGSTTVTWTVMDSAGNTASDTQTITVVDTTPPTITAADSLEVTVGAPKSLLPSPTVSDIVDADPTVTNDAPDIFPPGETIVTWTATDDSGNSATATTVVTATYTFTGFLPPIKMTPAGATVLTINIGKVGQTFPVKWQVQSYGGTYVTTLDVVDSLTIQQVSVDSGQTAATPIDGTSPTDATATGGTSLRYDLIANQYVFNWSTKSGVVVGAYYQLVLTLNDGVPHTAYFRFTK